MCQDYCWSLSNEEVFQNHWSLYISVYSEIVWTLQMSIKESDVSSGRGIAHRED